MNKKIIGFTALNYGSMYLPYSMGSIIRMVDEYYILYSPNGSHGARASIPLPESESRDNLKRLASAVAGKKLRWIEGDWQHEGEQRDSIYDACPDADVILVADYDEIWTKPEDLITEALLHPVKVNRIRMWHYWRSFHQAITDDMACPVRIILPKMEETERTLQSGIIHHLGYAIPSWLMEYKMHIHGHRNEWRPDWLEQKWHRNNTEDCHPTNHNYWNAQTIAPGTLPSILRLHPYKDLTIIP